MLSPLNTGQHTGRPVARPVKSTGRPTEMAGQAVELVSDGPRRQCQGPGREFSKLRWAGQGPSSEKLMGRAEPSRGPSSESMMGRAGPWPTKMQRDGPDRAAAHRMQNWWAGPPESAYDKPWFI